MEPTTVTPKLARRLNEIRTRAESLGLVGVVFGPDYQLPYLGTHSTASGHFTACDKGARYIFRKMPDQATLDRSLALMCEAAPFMGLLGRPVSFDGKVLEGFAIAFAPEALEAGLSLIPAGLPDGRPSSELSRRERRRTVRQLTRGGRRLRARMDLRA